MNFFIVAYQGENFKKKQNIPVILDNSGMFFGKIVGRLKRKPTDVF